MKPSACPMCGGPAGRQIGPLLIRYHPLEAYIRGVKIHMPPTHVRLLDKLADGVTTRALEDLFPDSIDPNGYVGTVIYTMRRNLAQVAPEVRIESFKMPNKGRGSGQPGGFRLVVERPAGGPQKRWK